MIGNVHSILFLPPKQNGAKRARLHFEYPVSVQLCCDAVIILCLDVSTSAREGFGCLVIIAYHELNFFLIYLERIL